MKLLLKIAAFAVAAASVVCAFAGCAGKTGTDETEENTTVAALPGSEEGGDVTEEINEDKLGKADFGGSEYVILSRKRTLYEYQSTDEDGDIVKSAVTKRNTDIEDRFNVKIVLVEEPGDWGDRDKFIARVEKGWSSGSKTYDLVSTHSAYAVNIALKGFAYNMAALPDVDFTNKWWCPMYTENVTVDGAAYTAVGDIGYTLYEYMMCVFMNKTLAAKYIHDDIYATVRNGDWTYEKMLEIVLTVREDTNGNGTPDDGDVFGLAMSGHACRGAATYWDGKITVKGDDGKHVMNISNEKYIDIYSRLYSLVYDHKENVAFKNEGASNTPEFVNGHILFFPEKFLEASSMRDMADEYGILPMPKYDSDQENYISCSRDAMNAVAVMRNIDDPEMVGKVTEALCLYGRQLITPAYYETTLKFRYLSDPDAVYVLDLIRDTLTFDFAMTYTNAMGLVYSVLGDNIQSGNKDISSVLRSFMTTGKRYLSEIYKAYDKIKG